MTEYKQTKIIKMSERFIILIIVLFSIGFFNPSLSNASKIDELRNKIEDRNTNITELEKEIEEYQEELEKVGDEKKSLNNEIYRLNLDRKKLSTDLNLTDNKIQSTSLSIEKLAMDVIDKENRISNNMIALSESIRMINEYDTNSLVEILLASNDISEFWQDIDNIERFQVGVREKTSELLGLKISLESDKSDQEEKKRDLNNYRSDVADQKQVVDYNKREKDQLLSLTKNKEENYKIVLAEKERLMEEFEQELRDLESQLEIEIDPNSIPSTGYGVITWPLDSPYITQYFGKTAFSTKNPQVYNGKGHTGIDFRASVGTKIKSVSGGTVRSVGNTDSYPPKCYSYGKWVLVDHNNGLSSLYAHLSVIKVSAGQAVNKGDVIGYSGNTGYSTGPHLHFSLYATKGVQVKQFTNSINCKDKFIPLAPYNAYLNPLSYLPKL